MFISQNGRVLKLKYFFLLFVLYCCYCLYPKIGTKLVHLGLCVIFSVCFYQCSVYKDIFTICGTFFSTCILFFTLSLIFIIMVFFNQYKLRAADPGENNCPYDLSLLWRFCVEGLFRERKE